jgi:hypothetical protein
MGGTDTNGLTLGQAEANAFLLLYQLLLLLQLLVKMRSRKRIIFQSFLTFRRTGRSPKTDCGESSDTQSEIAGSEVGVNISDWV